MEYFKIGQEIKINDLMFSVKAFYGDSALCVEKSDRVGLGDMVPIIIKLNKEKTKFKVLQDEEEVKTALTRILMNGKYI